MDANLQAQLKVLIQKINTGNVALFIGAGCSISAGLPDGKTLTEALKLHFEACNQQLSDFMDVCQDIEETPPYDSLQVADFIKQKLDLFELTDAHKILTKFPWSSIFTTNFDNVIETAYNTTKDRHKSCYPISNESPSVNISDRSKIYLFKLMGTVDSHDATSAMVLTRSEYHNSIIKRNQYLKLLSDFIKSGTIIYIGYSFKDQIVKDVIGGLAKLHGISKIPWSYMLLRDEVPQDTKSQFFFNSNRIIPIQADFATFFRALGVTQLTNPIIENTINQPKATLNILGKHVSIGEHSYNMYAASFDFLHEEILQTSGCNMDEFLRGKAKCWFAYQKNWDFKRSVFNSKDRLLNFTKQLSDELKEFDANKNKILYLTGMPGCGKTIFTYRIAYDIYMESRLPVMVFNKNSNIDFKIVSSFIEDVNNEYEKLLPENEKAKPVKVVLIFDDVSSNLKDIIRLNEFLISRGRTALIIANGRQSELDTNSRSINFKLDQRNFFLVEETLNLLESKIITSYLFEHKFITSKSTRWEDLISKDYSNSFFATFYSLVHPSRRPLDDIIKDQFNSLSDFAQEAFLNICCFSQYNISINIELLVRSLDISYEQFYILLDDVQKVIFEEEDYNGNILYKSHHRIIAQKTLEFFIPERVKLFERYQSVLQKCILYNNKEKEIVERLLIDNFSTKIDTELFSLEQQKDLFIAACKDSASRSILHHLALIEMELEEYGNAEDHLLSALELPRENSELYKGESDQNILTSLGKLNSNLAIQAFRTKSFGQAEIKFQAAEDYFNEAKHGDYPNVYAYHANAHMWFIKAKNDSTDQDRVLSLAKSLEIIDLAKDNLNENELLPLFELETQIWSLIGDEQAVKSFIEVISNKYNSANGYFIYAYYYFRKSLNSTEFKDLYYDRALVILNDGLAKHLRDEKCLSLKCKISILRNNVSEEELFDILEEWKSVAKNDNAQLLYHYARIAFVQGYYEQSKELFEELEDGVGMGNKHRSRSAHEVIDHSTGVSKVFSGEVTDIYSKYDGNIKVTSVSSKLFIKFRPITAKFNVYRGAPVKFNIGFSFRGPTALNIIKS